MPVVSPSPEKAKLCNKYTPASPCYKHRKSYLENAPFIPVLHFPWLASMYSRRSPVQYFWESLRAFHASSAVQLSSPHGVLPIPPLLSWVFLVDISWLWRTSEDLIAAIPDKSHHEKATEGLKQCHILTTGRNRSLFQVGSPWHMFEKMG